jgi:hypothetical protein
MTANKSGIFKTLMVGTAVALTLSSTTQRLIFAADWERESRSASARFDELRRQNELLTTRLEGFEKRLASLAAAGAQGPSRVQEPFEVVDHSGQILFQVTGGFGTSAPSRGRVQIARGTHDNFLLTFRRPDGSVSAVLAEAPNGVGSLQLRDGSGNERVRVDRDGGVRLLGPKGESVAGLGFKDASGARGLLQIDGLFKIFDGGKTVVEIGTNPAGVGVVTVGPGETKCLPYAGLRVPDCIVGRP